MEGRALRGVMLRVFPPIVAPEVGMPWTIKDSSASTISR